ncbi:MAG: AmmeMemoRadiSam system protein B [Anaerolineae bacterium]|nr:AmmeMemoRadiSam system protein B [Anaerolineae bacterium]
MRSDAIADVRPSPIAGMWYPGNPIRLRESVSRLLDASKAPPVSGEIIGLIAPHAGHVYSGPVAAGAFSIVQGMAFDRVVVVCPLHQPQSFAPVLTSGHHAYETPLGVIPVDRDALNRLEEHMPLRPIRFDGEHALEIELPFLQVALDGPFTLLPLMLREQTLPLAAELAEALVKALAGDGKRTLYIASSDLSHFYTQQQAAVFDQRVLDSIEAFDAKAVIRLDDEGKGFACGRGAIATVLLTAQRLGATHARVVHYATSGDVTGDFGRVVGYGAAVLTREVQ